MGKLEDAELNLKLLNGLIAAQAQRPDQSIRVTYSLEENRHPHVSRHGLYVAHFEVDGLWNIEILDIAETIHDPNRDPFDFSDIFKATIENTDEAWEAVSQNDIVNDLNGQKVVRWLGDLVAPIFSLY